MNLTELQTELRSMEEHLSALQKKIGRMKPETEEEKKRILPESQNWQSSIP